jgi:hypothetical protein
MRNRWPFLVSVVLGGIFVASSFFIAFAADTTRNTQTPTAFNVISPKTYTSGTIMLTAETGGPSTYTLLDAACVNSCNGLAINAVSSVQVLYMRTYTRPCEKVRVNAGNSLYIPIKFSSEWTSFCGAAANPYFQTDPCNIPA